MKIHRKKSLGSPYALSDFYHPPDTQFACARERGRPSAELLEMRTCAHLSPTVSLSFVETLQQRSLYCVMCRTIPPFFFLFFLSLFLSLVHADNFFSLKEEGGDKEGLVTFDQRARVRIFHRCSLFCSLPSPLFFPNIGSFLSRDRSWSFPR